MPANYFPILADMHSHILPGIDDGSPDIETSLMLIRGLIALGIHKSVATPHIIGDMYRNNPDTIFNALSTVTAAIEKEGLDFSVIAAAEYMLDHYFFELLDNKSVLLTVTDNLILTEFSYSSRPSHPEEMSFAIQTEGFVPILAHPERYAYYHTDLKQFHRLKDLGFLLQVNLLSLAGYYGKDTARAARYLVKEELVSFVGTDLHHERHLSALQSPANRQLFAEVFSNNTFNEKIFSADWK
ncbi:MAG: hypothetical protein JWQ27_156 [Ferruginibacter sp.]|nr:hypothetical protein [Ferruginibacter sp.]